jgi:hypothetical protein
MYVISKTYAIRGGMAAKKDDEPLKNRAIYLPESIDEAFEADAKRWRRSFVKHLEALIVTYLALENVELVANMKSVRTAMQELVGEPAFEADEIETKLGGEMVERRGQRNSKTPQSTRVIKRGRKGK